MIHIIIALNSAKNRKVGNVISLLEGRGFELVNYHKKTTSPSCREYPDIEQFFFQNQFEGMKAMAFYHKKFSPKVLDIKMRDFRRNHVELTFESGGKSVNSDELWESISKNIFGNGRKLPIMFITKEGDGDIIVDDSKIKPIEVETFTPTRATDIVLD